jgi:hypothetical protein
MFIIYYLLKQFKPMKTDSNHYSLGYLKVNEKPANQLIVVKRQNEIKMEDGKIHVEEYGEMPPHWPEPLLARYKVYDKQEN